MEGYSVKIIDASFDLTARDKVRFKAFDDMYQLDTLVTPEEPLLIDVTGYVIAEVHNEKSDNKDYTKFIIVGKDGNNYITGSEPFWNQFKDVYSEMREEEGWQLKVYKRESKNYKGKQFLTCTVA